MGKVKKDTALKDFWRNNEKEISKNYNKEGNWCDFSEDKFLSRMKKEDKIIPCLTVIIYYGEKDWDGPQSLSDMVDIPQPLQPTKLFLS